MRWYYKKRWIKERDIGLYDDPPDPTKLIWVDPFEIKYFTNRPGKYWRNRIKKIGCVKKGDWDIGGVKLTDHCIYQSMVEHFIGGVQWAETTTFRKKNKAYTAKDYEINQSKYDHLWKEIKKNGYKTQFEIYSSQNLVKSLPFLLINEICVDIGREGELLLVDSKHRIALAQILNLESIPVFVLCRHTKWMEKRKENAKIESKYKDHPDLIN